MKDSIKDIEVPNNYMPRLLSFVEKRGGSGDDLAAIVGLSKQDLLVPNRLLRCSQICQLFAEAQRLSKEPAIGLYLGSQLAITTHGSLGFAALSSADLATALALVAQYFNTRTPLAAIEVTRDEKYTYFSLKELFPLGAARVIFIETVISAILRAAEYILQERFICEGVEFSFDEPNYGELYSVFFDYPATFNAVQTRVCIRTELLTKTLPLADESAHNMAKEICEEEFNSISGEEQLDQTIRNLLLKVKGDFPSVEAMAVELNCSPRTLSRRLREIDTSYHKIVDATRQYLASQYLDNTSLNVQEISYLLGYNDPSSFGRAFKKWFSQSPHQYRKREKS